MASLVPPTHLAPPILIDRGEAASILTPVPPTTDSPKLRGGRFAENWRWTVVLSAQAKDSREAGAALETLCRTYWPPLYAFARQSGCQPADAQDATQEFFARLLSHDYLRSVAPEKGRFRSFLLVAFKRFLANERERSRAQKRGGRGQPHLAFDVGAAETRYHLEPLDGASADKIFEAVGDDAARSNNGAVARGIHGGGTRT